ncbi:hypothetical protein EBU94_02055 [bacterium]|nr:hypothetical protein [bacterium]
MITWVKALWLYFNVRNTNLWYRDSTNEWVYEVDVTIENEYNCVSRYSNKLKFVCYFQWFRFFWSVVSDLRNFV